jgi:hypothetical protein
VITKKQQEILDSIESESSREHYRAQFEMQNELGDDVEAGGIFDAPNVAGFLSAPGYDNSRNVLRQEIVAGKEVSVPDGLLGEGPRLSSDEAIDEAIDEAERAAGLGRVSPEDVPPAEQEAPSMEVIVETVAAEVAAKERRLVTALVVLTVAIVLFAAWWLS